MSIPISTGSGAASVAAEAVGGLQYQQIELYGRGAASILSIDPAGAALVSVYGNLNVNISGQGSVMAVIPGSVITVWKDSSVIAIATGSVVAIPTGVQSVAGAVNVSGSVLLGSSNASVITVWQNSSVITIPQGFPSVLSYLPSIVGATSESTVDTASKLANNSAGALFVNTFPFVFNGTTWNKQYGNSSVGAQVSTGIRNDTLSSIYGSDNIPYRAAFGPAGEQIVANAPLTKWIQGTADMRGGAAASGGSVAVIAAQGASIFSYITSFQVANFGPSSVLVTFSGATSSVIGYTIAPAGGGSNAVLPNALKTNANGVFSASVSGLSSVLVSAQGFIAKI